jgi:hypothetical protein
MKTKHLFQSNFNPKFTILPIFIFTIFYLSSLVTFAQIDTTKNSKKNIFSKEFLAEQFTISAKDSSKGKLSFNAYADFGYVVGPQKKHTFFDQIVGNTVTQFGRRDYTSYPLYANQFSIAYAYLQAQYEIENKLRLRIAFHTGHIVDALTYEETPSTKMIRELALYWNFNSKWATEIGVFPSYFGSEVMTSKDNLHATRGYIADFTPDYEAGIRLHYIPNKYNTFSAMVLNGWQVIRETNTTKAFALAWSLNKPGKITANWNLMFADEQNIFAPNPLFRHYQNIYCRVWLGKKWLILPVIDVMVERKPQNQTPGWNHIIAPAISARYKINNYFGVAGKYEYIYDAKGLIPELRTGTPNGWQCNAVTLTTEYLPSNLVTFRLEAKYGINKDAVFRNGMNELVRQDWYAIFSTAFNF